MQAEAKSIVDHSDQHDLDDKEWTIRGKIPADYANAIILKRMCESINDSDMVKSFRREVKELILISLEIQRLPLLEKREQVRQELEIRRRMEARQGLETRQEIRRRIEARQELEIRRRIVEDLEFEISAVDEEAARRLMDQALPLPRHMILNLTSFDLETLTALEDTGQIQRS